jgi:serine/threonine-protein kinase HipA
MLLSGSQRIGALDFQQSNSNYQPRVTNTADLQQLLQAANIVGKGERLPPELDSALLHGTSVGGARPKAMIASDDAHYIAKFSASTDHYDVVKAEFVAMRFAALVGIDIAEVTLQQVLNKDVLLVKRFDRDNQQNRRLMLSGLSLLQLNEMEGRYASYKDLADLIRRRFDQPKKTLKELFQRIVFNILIGNTDDHARNHAAFWDGESLCLTPAYDICPQPRVGQEATQAMDLEGVTGNFSTLVNALSISKTYMLNQQQAKQIIDQQIDTIKNHWDSVCSEAKLGDIERQRLWQGCVFNPYCFIGYDLSP